MDMVETLRADGVITDAQAEEARRMHAETGDPVSIVLVKNGLATRKDLARALAHRAGFQFYDLADVVIPPEVLNAVPEQTQRRLSCIPVEMDDKNQIVVAMSDPGDVLKLDDVRMSAGGRPVTAAIALKEDIQQAIDRFHSKAGEIGEVAGQFDLDDDEHDDLSSLTSVGEDDAPVVKFVNLLISEAVRAGASDIHVEPQEKELRIRYRVDGVLHQFTTADRRIIAGVVSRLKIMAEVDISEKRIPQDGRIALMIDGKKIDLRFSTLPGVFGEKIVMRILDKSSIQLSLDDLGFAPDNFSRFESAYVKPYGMILVTGPTGSGKSTTLYATLNVKNNIDVNIVTVEDPVEYQLPGIHQVQANPKAGLTFASALRSILRQDPDIVLIGEMRDKETATIGVEAALTGHLVLSTLHTNDAPSAVTRLTEMGVEPFLITTALEAVLAQRLARRICAKCMDKQQLAEQVYLDAGFDPETAAQRPPVPVAVGCNKCGDTGYKGRLAVHEVLLMSDELRSMVNNHANSDDLAAQAAKEGMRSLREDGLMKVLAGDTTLEEIARVIV